MLDMFDCRLSMSGQRSRILPHNDSSQIAQALFGDNPAVACRKRSAKPKNIVAENIKEVRRKSEQNKIDKAKQEAESTLMQNKNTKFRMADQLQRRSSTGSSDSNGCCSSARLSGRDFVRENARSAAIRSARHCSFSSETQREIGTLHKPGTIPDYLVQRKMELAQQYAEELVGDLPTCFPLWKPISQLLSHILLLTNSDFVKSNSMIKTQRMKIYIFIHQRHAWTVWLWCTLSRV